VSAVLCFGIALVSTLALFAFSFVKKGRQRLAALLIVMAYVATLILLMTNYSFVRDHVRWVLLSTEYKAKVLAQTPGEELKYAEWDGWGFAGADTTVFLVFDPNRHILIAARVEKLERSHGRTASVIEVLVEDIDRLAREVKDIKALPPLAKRRIGFIVDDE
jgi:hypothetical protein